MRRLITGIIIIALFAVSYVCAGSLTYTASTETLAEMSYFGVMRLDKDSLKVDNGRAETVSSVSDDSNLVGSVTVSAWSQGSVEPNQTAVLDAYSQCGYQYKDFWALADYFYQETYTVNDASFVITDYPANYLCSVSYEVVFPQNTQVGGVTAWKLNIAGPYSSIEAGYNEQDQWFGNQTGMLSAIGGSTLVIKLQHLTGGYNDFETVDMANGIHHVQVRLKAVAHPADLNMDGHVSMPDIRILSSQWFNSSCNSDNSWCGRADINKSGQVALQDVYWLSYYWLLND